MAAAYDGGQGLREQVRGENGDEEQDNKDNKKKNIKNVLIVVSWCSMLKSH